MKKGFFIHYFIAPTLRDQCILGFFKGSKIEIDMNTKRVNELKCMYVK